MAHSYQEGKFLPLPVDMLGLPMHPFLCTGEVKPLTSPAGSHSAGDLGSFLVAFKIAQRAKKPSQSKC